MIKTTFTIFFLLAFHFVHGQNRTIAQQAPYIIKKYFLQECIKGSAISWTKAGNAGDLSVGVYYFYEIKGLKWTIKQNKLTSSDKTNGYQWRGKLLLTANQFREFPILGQNAITSPRLKETWGKWHEFPKGYYYIAVEQINGKWIDYQVSGSDAIPIAGPTKPSCEDLKKETDKRIGKKL